MGKPNYRRYITSKWAKTKALLPNHSIAKHIPDTRVITRNHLHQMLERYGMVYVKPDNGTYGIGVMRVERESGQRGGRYRYQAGTIIRTFSRFDAMYDSILKLTRKRRYVVQKGIHLLKYNKRRFDLRVMVQQSPSKHWVTTGIIGRVAAQRKVVTNVHNGGTLVSFDTLLKGHAGTSRRMGLSRSLNQLGLTVAKQMKSRYPGIKELGLDVALDQRLYPWILEVNTAPDPFIFSKLKDKRIYARIYRYAKAYGRL
ncbi:MULTISPECIES: YheC/YheD family protein [unclassified Paenibacillus]|uniref:YheC/YheD family protein n=1 Tax=unclassified Paenibacillus TaxID=185978 RepID=UPI001AE2C551|nr:MULTISPECIES: YheC/YheD family protein [unclassified Paenibacillus]MBP1157077.1 glutathione synthase/RimK-type ligase-like ATP-grasp enzyme [Paenibacillus sp. PvP091]MBP1172184.1 glutathione synthase/RimK-type ligase-like ATP-grasp enzyme [Paenibacillus sp. PvR098]MBP2438565.1 glutathione synthase/RimK-type ligase-like ATP-grasp enzyme [Paenibacillus sp. PvP052]